MFLVCLAVLCLYKITPAKFHEGYAGVKQSTSIKGIFIIIVFLSHTRGYLDLSGGLNSVYDKCFSKIGQMMVALFFFYSGYGIMYSYKNKTHYEKGFIKKRVGSTLLHFDIAVLAFLLVGLLIKSTYSLKSYLLCWIGWEGIGNSNWYIFDILVLYLLSWAAFMIHRHLWKSVWCVPICITLLSILFMILLALCRKSDWWYDTVLCYPFGVIYFLIQNKIDAACQKNIPYFVLLFGSSAVFGILYLFLDQSVIAYNIQSCLFCLIVLMVTMKLKIGNAILELCGKKLFLIYILQRIPMNIESFFQINAFSPFLFTLIAIIATIPLVLVFEKLFDWTDKRLMHQKKPKRI